MSGGFNGPEFVEDLRKLIRERKVFVVIGSGVSKSTTSAAPMWRDLIKSAHTTLCSCYIVFRNFATNSKLKEWNALGN